MKIFIIREGGQQVRRFAQQTEFNKKRFPLIVEIEETDWVEKAQCEGQNSFTNAMWSTNLEDLQRWANEWVGEKVEVTVQ